MAKRRKSGAKKRKIVFCAVVAVLIVAIIAAAIIIYIVNPDIYHKYLGFGDHSWTEWSIDKQADCGHDGSRSHTCTVCGEKQTETISASGNHSYNGDICTVCGYDNSAPSVEKVSSSNLSIHFLELGNKSNGDCVLVKCGDTEVLIDAGSAKNSAPALKTYIDQYCTDSILEYVIATHSDEDHISAFVGSKSGDSRDGLLYQYNVKTLIHFDYATNSGGVLYGQFMDAVDYCKTAYNTSVYTASQCYSQTDGAKRQYYLNAEQTISLNVLYNYYYYNLSSDNNNHSVVTLFTEKTAGGKHNYLFTGDLEGEGESKMVDYYKSVPAEFVSEYNVLPENVDLFKAGHHGSGTSSTEKLLSVIKPQAVAICCCCGAPEYTQDPKNTFPYQVTCNRLLNYTRKIYVTSLATGLPELGEDGKYVSKKYGGYTSMNGNIVFYSNGNQIKLWCSNNSTPLPDTEWFKTNRT